MTASARARADAVDESDLDERFAPREPVTPPGVVGLFDPDLVPLLVPIESVHEHPRNPHAGDDSTLALSLRTFGQKKSVSVQASTRYVAAGNTTLRAARRNGWTHIAASVSAMSDEDTVAYMLADNRTGELGSYDEAALVALARELPSDLLTASGYSSDDLDDLLRDLEGSGDDDDAARVTAGAGASVDDVPERFEVLVACDSDSAQAALLERLIAEGYECRALVS